MKFNFEEGKVVWYFFRSYKMRSFIVFIFMLISGSFEALNLAALYPIINYGLNLDKKSFMLRNFEKISDIIISNNRFLAACVLLIIVSVIALVFKYCYYYLSNKLLICITGDTQKQIFSKFVAADYGFYVKNQQGKLIYAGTVASEKITVVVFFLLTLIYHVINSLFLFGLLVFLSWQATFLIVLVGVFYGLVIKKIMQKYINKCAAICVKESQKKNIILNEFISGFKAIKAFLAIHEWESRYVKAVNIGLINRFHMLVARVFPEIFIKFLFYVLIALTGIFLSYQSHADIIALLPMLGTFAIVVNRFLPSIHLMGSGIMKIAELMPDVKIVYKLCNEEFSAHLEGDKTLEGFKDKIVFEGVSFKYDNMENDLLKEISFSIERRKMTALVGASGSGKTTIINLLLKLYSPDKGSIKIDGENILDLKNSSYLSKIGYVSQETFIYNNTIKENIRFGKEDCTDQMIEAAAKLANAHEFIIDTPQGYETVVGDAGVKLSGGQRQRIAIARAMLRNPEIIVFDEATSSLDNLSEKKIQVSINNISKHTTVLVIAHRLTTVQNADKIIILGQGEIKEQGTHRDLLENKKMYYDLYMLKDHAD